MAQDPEQSQFRNAVPRNFTQQLASAPSSPSGSRACVMNAFAWELRGYPVSMRTNPPHAFAPDANPPPPNPRRSRSVNRKRPDRRSSMNPHRWLLIVQLAAFGVFAGIVVPLMESHPQLAAIALFSTLIFGAIGTRIRCPNCGLSPVRRSHPDIPLPFYAPR